jgi:hypothetical protein
MDMADRLVVRQTDRQMAVRHKNGLANMKMDRTDELVANRQTENWTVKQTDGLANRQTDRNEKERLIGGKTDRLFNSKAN